MIASRLGLIISSIIALALLVVVLLDGGATAPPSRALVPGLDVDTVTRLAWSRASEPEVVLDRATTVDKKMTWKWVKPIEGIPAEPAAIDTILAALRGGRWHRRAAIGQAGLLRVALTVTAGKRVVKIGVGAPLEGAGQTWLAIDERAYLVDDWVARALAPDPSTLRETRPLRDVAAAHRIVIDRLNPAMTMARIEGFPRRIVKPIELMLSPEPVTSLQRALSNMTIAGMPDKPIEWTNMVVSTDPPLVNVEFQQGGCNPGFVAIGGSAGKGCITTSDYEAIHSAIDALKRPPVELAERRPAPIDPLAITLSDGAVIDLKAKPRIGDSDVDSAALAELMSVLAAPANVVANVDAKPAGTIAITDRAGTTIELEILAKHVRRKGEPVALELGAGAIAILMRPSSGFRESLLWREDPMTIDSITIGAITFKRGAVIGEWSDARFAAALNALANTLAVLHGRPTTTPPRVTRTIAFETVPPSGPRVTRTIELGAKTAAGCEAIVEGKPTMLDARVCDEVSKIRP